MVSCLAVAWRLSQSSRIHASRCARYDRPGTADLSTGTRRLFISTDLQPPAPDPLLVIGIGCRRGCAAQQLLELVASGLQELGLNTGAIGAVASIDLKGAEPGLLALAEQLQVPLILLSATTLLPYEAQLTHRSALAYARTGCHGVAESAALAAASQLTQAPARLLITRRQSAHATFALAGALVEG